MRAGTQVGRLRVADDEEAAQIVVRRIEAGLEIFGRKRADAAHVARAFERNGREFVGVREGR
jgi:hypothetical protein